VSKKNSRKNSSVAKPKQSSPASIYINRAQAFLRDNEIQRGINMLLQGIKVAPENAVLHAMLGEQLGKHGRAEASVKHYEKALELDPDMLMVQVNLAQAYSQQNRFNDAEPLINKALNAAPSNPSVYMAYGVMQQRRGKLPESVEHFRKALRLKLEQPEVATKDSVKKTPTKKKREDFNKPETEELLWDTLNQLAKANVHAFAIYGTSLGLVREGGLISFDKDIDVGLPHTEMERAIRCLENNGWVEVPNQFLTNPRSMVHSVKKVTVDLSGFVVDEKSNTVFTGLWLKEDVPHEWNANTYYPPLTLKKDVTPGGEPIWSLTDPKAWLVAVYGENWKVPDPAFDTVVQTNNYIRFSLLAQCYAFSRIYNKWQEGQITKAFAMVKSSLVHLPGDSLLEEIQSRLDTLT
jgi:tetratricopeptide (TPR) repeat protein